MGLGSNTDISPIIREFGTWAVTSYGVECLVRYYPIEKARLNKCWVAHMSQKTWLSPDDLYDLESALNYGRTYFHK